MTTTELLKSSSIAATIVGFSEDPFRAARELRRFLEIDPSHFRDTVLAQLAGEAFTAGHQYALTLLISEGLVLDQLCDPKAMAKKDACRLARQIDSLDGTLIYSVASSLLRGQTIREIPSNMATMRHALELLEHTAGAHRIMPLLTQLLRHSDHRIRAKATLLLGKINKNLQWAQERMMDSDARVRASALEAMWGLETPEACKTFESAVSDAHGRVAANAAFGLYCLGDLSTPEHLIRMLAAPAPMRRASAAWAMGKTGDVRFLSDLTGVAMDPDAIVRKNVFQALSKIRLRVKRLADEHPLEVIIARVATLQGIRRLEVAVLSKDDQPLLKVRPMNFVVRDAGNTQHQLTVSERPRQEFTNVTFAVPHDPTGHSSLGPAITKAFQEFLRYKRKSDEWGAIRYTASACEEPGVLGREKLAPASTQAFEIFRKNMLKPNPACTTPHAEVDSRAPDSLRTAMLPSAGGPVSSLPTKLECTLDPEPRPIRFALDANALLAVSDSAGTVSSSANNLHDALSSLIGSMAFAVGARHIFIVAHGSTLLSDASVLEQRAKDAHVQVSALLIGPQKNSTIENLCRDTDGVSITVASPQQLSVAGRRIAALLMSFYRIEYEAPSEIPLHLSIQVLSDQGYGKDELGEQQFS